MAVFKSLKDGCLKSHAEPDFPHRAAERADPPGEDARHPRDGVEASRWRRSARLSDNELDECCRMLAKADIYPNS